MKWNLECFLSGRAKYTASKMYLACSIKWNPKSQHFQNHVAIQEEMKVILLTTYSSHVCINSQADMQGIMMYITEF